MKLRFEKGALRYRVRKSDMEQLKNEGVVTESVRFPSGELHYELHIADVAETSADIHQNSISVSIPREIAGEWINSNEVGIYHNLYLHNDILTIAIEKDFPCKDRTDEDKSDTFTELTTQPGNKNC